MPSVSLISPIRNGGLHYPACFESLCRLDYYEGGLEVHVIDDCSTDGTRGYLQQQLPPEFIRLHFPEANLGRARARNLALSQATGEVIIFLDGDMEILPNFVIEHIAELAKPGRQAVIGRVEPAPWLPKSKLNNYLYAYPHRGARQFGPDTPVPFHFIPTNNLSLTRQALNAGGTLDESFLGYGGEDTLFGYHMTRIFPNGIYYSDQPVSYHHQDRTLEAHLELLYDYGYYNLSCIVSGYPEIAAHLAADFTWPLAGAYFRFKRALGRLLFNPLTRFIGRALLSVTPFPISNLLVRFLFIASVVQGLRHYVSDNQLRAGRLNRQ